MSEGARIAIFLTLIAFALLALFADSVQRLWQSWKENR